MDWHRNDRLGWPALPKPVFEHWREILRGCTGSDPHANAHSNSNRDGDGHSYIYTKTYAHSEEHTIG